jgi:exodeoxyribonuclease VII small subunit
MAEQSFEKSIEKLEKTVQEMEQGEVNLDNMLQKFEEGMKLAKFCTKKLDEAEKKIEILIKKQDGTIETTPFDTTQQTPREAQNETISEETENSNEQELF